MKKTNDVNNNMVSPEPKANHSDDSTSMKQPACSEKSYMVYRHELPLSCPTDEMVLWNAHPKVYLPIEKTGTELCPYCGSRFILQDN